MHEHALIVLFPYFNGAEGSQFIKDKILLPHLYQIVCSFVYSQGVSLISFLQLRYW